MARIRPLLALALVAPVTLAAQQPVTITGTVRTQTHEPVRGAAVAIPALDLTTITNDVGLFRIVVPADRVRAGEEVVLRIQSIGYRTAEIPIRLRPGALRQDVTMVEEAVQLEQVVVTGTAGRQQVRAQAAKIERVDAARLAQIAPVRSVGTMLQARVPGVSIAQGSGSSGTAQRIRIRGISSISLSNDPLIFIDGVRADNRIGGDAQIFSVLGQGASRLNDLRPEDIESIEVVKGPAAATLYGADASAGVIQIITKRGRAGGGFSQTLSLEYGRLDTSFEPPDNWAVCTAQTATRPACQGLPAGTFIRDNPIKRYEVFQPGTSRAISWSLRGGGDRYSVFLSAGADDEDGTVPNNAFGRLSLRANVDFFPRENLRIEAGFGLARTRTQLPHSDNSIYGFVAGGLLGNALTRGEAADGWYSGFGQKQGRAAIENVDQAVRIQPRVAVHWTPTPNFTHRLVVGGDLTHTKAWQFFPKNNLAWYGSDQLNAGQIAQARDLVDDWTIDYLANYALNLSPSLRLDLSAGSQTLLRYRDLVSATGTRLVANPARSVGAASERTGTQAITENRSNGFYGQVQLSHADRLYVQLAGRLDRNSSFGTESQYFFSPRVGASYVISEEPFWQELAGSVIPTLRLRASYGTTGRSPTSGALPTYDPAPYALVTTGLVSPGVLPDDPGNAELRPERGTELELGLDAGLLDERLSLELTYFDKTTRDALLRRPIAPSLGFDTNPWANIGEIVNRGFEIAATARLVTTSNVGWETRLAFNTLHNEVTSLGDISPFGTTNRVRAGAPVNSYHTLRIRRVDTERGVAIVSDTLEFVGNLVPGWEGTLLTTLNLFRHLTLYAQFDFRGDVRRYNASAEFRERQFRNDAKWVLRDSLLTPEQRLRRFGPFQTESGQTVTFGQVLEEYIEDGSYLRLREVSLNYRLPTAVARLMRAADATVTLAGRNLKTWTEFSGLDPETIYVQNTEFFTIPADRRWLLRVNLRY